MVVSASNYGLFGCDICGYFGHTWENKCRQPVQVGQGQGIGAFPEQSEIKQSILLVGNLLMNIYFNFLLVLTA